MIRANRRKPSGWKASVSVRVRLFVLFVLFVFAAAVGPGAGPVFADMHVVMESTVTIAGRSGMPQFGDEADVQQFFMKDGRVAIPSSEGEEYLFMCDVGEFALIARPHGVYWRGTVEQFISDVQDAFAFVGAEDWDWADEMFGSGRADVAVPVRTVRVGEETVAGYDTVHYRVEYEQEGAWRLYEELWLSPALLREVESEVGSCFNDLVQEGQTTMVGLFLGEADEMWAIMTSPEYTGLFREGFPVRSVSIVEQFGVRVETTSGLVRVERDPLSEDMFVIPDDFEALTILEMMM